MGRSEHSTRARLRAGIVAPLIACALVAGCGGGDESSQGVVTTGPEPGAEVSPVLTPTISATTPGQGTPKATTPSDDQRDDKKAKSTLAPTPTLAADPDAEPTIAPPSTLKPKADTDAVDLAFSRQINYVQLASNAFAQAVIARGRDADFRKLAEKISRRRNDDLNAMATWGDVLGLKPGTGLEPEAIAKDMRTLGASVAQMTSSRALIKSGKEPFEGVADDAFDEAAADAMIENSRSGIIIATRTVTTGGSERFRKFAARYAANLRKELRELRALKRSW